MNKLSIDEIINICLDYYSVDDLQSAKCFLEESLTITDGEKITQIIILNELLGVYRKLSLKEKAYLTVIDVISRIESIDNDMLSATVCLNCGTVFCNFKVYKESLDYYKKAENYYLSQNYVPAEKYSALYNNMGLALFGYKEYDEALVSFEKALYYAERHPKRNIEKAITFLNIADVYSTDNINNDKIEECLRNAIKNLESCENRDAEYAFTCLKCSDSFERYGNTEYSNILKERAKEIYERNRDSGKIL